AEDGIRDFHVTGVQTCALPISCLAAIGVECSAAGVGRLYGARRPGSGQSEPGLLDGWLVDESDRGTEVPGVTVRAVPLWMTDDEDRKSTRLNSSHVKISYAVFC